MIIKLKELLNTGVATAIAFGLMTGFVYGQGQPDVPEENPDDAPPPVEREQPDEMPGDERGVPTEPGERQAGEREAQMDRDVENGDRDSLADQLVRDHPDTNEIQRHLEEALIASGVDPEEAAEKSEKLARKITDALAESSTEADEFDIDGEFDENRDTERDAERGGERGTERGAERDTEEDEENDNGGLW